MSAPAQSKPSLPGLPGLPGWDALLVMGLLLAHIRVTSLAEAAVLPFLRQDVLRHPFLGSLLPAQGIQAMGERGPMPGEPIGLLLIALSLGMGLLYLLVDLLGRSWGVRVKWALLAGILLTALFLPTGKLILLREQSGPASYTHDGGVIQTEATIDFFLSGQNPYIEDYTETPMAEWGFDEYRTALYHYPYLPWTFVSSAPFYLLGNWLGFYDQRLVYLLLMAVALALLPRLVADPRAKLGLVALVGLNPLMGLDVIFGQNDSYVLGWILLALIAWHEGEARQAKGAGNAGRYRILASLLYGLACATKPTAWFFAPFFGLLMVRSLTPAHPGWLGLLRVIPAILRQALPALAAFTLLLGPYLLWDWYALYEDVWRWSSGQGETGYQIWGWGASNFVLALGWVESRFDLWPFWLPQMLLSLPVLLWLIRRQQGANRLGLACWHYGLFLLTFFYASRFLNENYLGYILAFLAVGFVVEGDRDREGR
jgi:hypothetical protein